MTGSGLVHVLAPAKINLYLEVFGRRSDGYHALSSLMLAVDRYDELLLAPADDLSLLCDTPDLPSGPDNLVMRAAQLLRERSGYAGGAAIRLQKRIPWAAGLGGGSSDAAAALAGLNELWQLGRSTEELAALAAELGSDVPFFFHLPAAWVTGRGEVLRAVSVGRALEIVLVQPHGGLSTAEVYRELAWLRADGELKVPEEMADPPEGLLESLAQGDVESLATRLHNRLQEAAFRLSPEVKRWYDRLSRFGVGCLMSGSGSCLFVLCRDRAEAVRVVEEFAPVTSAKESSATEDGIESARVILCRGLTSDVP